MPPKISTFIFLLFVFLNPSILLASHVQTVKTLDGWRLLVDDEPYLVKGVCYTPARVGEDPNHGTLEDWMMLDSDGDGIADAPYESWVDINQNNRPDSDELPVGDFELLRRMGCNTIRLYDHASANPDIQDLRLGSETFYNHAPNKEILRDLFQTYGIRVAMGDLMGAYNVGSGAEPGEKTDYTDARQRDNMLRSVEDMVHEFKNEPFLLMWILGDENDQDSARTNAAQYPEAYARFVNIVAERIHMLDPHHPVCLCTGRTDFLFFLNRYAPSVDIYGINNFRRGGFGKLWDTVRFAYDRPVLLTAYGTGHPKVKDGVLDELDQAKVHQEAWMDIESHRAGKDAPGNAIGGFAFEWLDSWWRDGSPDEQNMSPDNIDTHEWNGIASQGDGRYSPFLRQLRRVYFMYQSLWTGAKADAEALMQNQHHLERRAPTGTLPVRDAPLDPGHAGHL